MNTDPNGEHPEPDFSEHDPDWENDKQVKKMKKEREEYNKEIRDCVQIVSNKIHLQPSEVDPDLESFVLFNSLNDGGIQDWYETHDSKLQVYIVGHKSHYSGRHMLDVGTSHYFFGLINLEKKYPLTYIFRETLREKIISFLIKNDLDFKDQKKFSRRFNLVTEDKEKLKILWLSKPLDELANFRDMEVEIKGNVCVFRASRQSICEEEAAKFADLAIVLKKILD